MPEAELRKPRTKVSIIQLSVICTPVLPLGATRAEDLLGHHYQPRLDLDGDPAGKDFISS